MTNCLFYIPVFDPEIDTWERYVAPGDTFRDRPDDLRSLRKRSPFAITAMLMIGAKCEDAGGVYMVLMECAMRS
jgi:hypothetical protein